VFSDGQGGLLDLALDPEFATNRLIYISYGEPGEDGASIAVARGVLGDESVSDLQVIFRQEPKVDGQELFGSRLVFAPDGTLFVTLADRFKLEPAQDLTDHLGTIIRINPDGSIPADNPFTDQPDARPEIWSYGHRNIQGAAIEPRSGVLWVAEMGPKGGDELNLILPGNNYGWPLVSWGDHYDGRLIPKPPTRPEFEDAVHYWSRAIAPSGMVFYTGDAFPEWRGDLLIGGLISQSLFRLKLDGNRVVAEERIPIGSRVRDVRQGPDGAIYLLTDQMNGKILRLSPEPADDVSSRARRRL
jgi:glucose/arabinose dehydrogenase